MNRNTHPTLRILAVLATIAVGPSVADDFEMTRWTIDGGGAMLSSGGDYELSSTIGQPDVGTMTGGDFELAGGFWFPFLAGDGNGDGNVDLVDYGAFEGCMTGRNGGSRDGQCSCFDTDGSGTVDMADFAFFQRTFTGP